MVLIPRVVYPFTILPVQTRLRAGLKLHNDMFYLYLQDAVSVHVRRIEDVKSRIRSL